MRDYCKCACTIVYNKFASPCGMHVEAARAYTNAVVEQATNE